MNAFGPEVVVIGGGFGTPRSTCCVEPAREVVRREALPLGAARCRSSRAQLGLDAGMIGAALAARDALE